VQQVEMLCVLPNTGMSRLQAKFLPIVFLNLALVTYTSIANAQSSSFVATEGRISGTVLLNNDHRPASQVAVSLKSHVAGIFRSILTDVEGHFEVRGLPPGTYEIVVDEPGYESARSSAQLNGPSAELVIYLRSSTVAESRRNNDMVSVRELKVPGKAQIEFQKGLERLAKDDPAGALSHLNKAIQLFPGYYEARYHIGAVELKLGRRDEAMQDFEAAIDLSAGRYALAQFGLGYLLYLEGKPREAEAILRRGLEVDANSPNGYAILGMTLLALDHPDEAETCAREALLRKPTFALAHLVLADVYAKRREYPMRIRELDAYLNLDPSGPSSDQVRQARELTLRVQAQSLAPN
jgi:tetratricopeptide (TPR) repeat protein